MAFNMNETDLFNQLFRTLYGMDYNEKCASDSEQVASADKYENKETAGYSTPSYWFEQNDNAISAYVELPGCAKENIDVTIEKNVVYVKASRNVAGKDKKYGLKFRINEKRDKDKMTVAYKDGLLTIIAPSKVKVVEQPKVTRLEIQ